MKPPETNLAEKHWMDAWHVNPSATREYDFIDGLRGIAILMVLACHALYVNPGSGVGVRFIGGFLGACGHGVTLFFALSGFLISWPFWKRKVAGTGTVVPPGYGWRRFWKIYPPLALTVLMLTPYYILRFGDWSYLSIAAQWLAGLPALMPVNGKFNPAMWTLVVEVQFYAVLPLFFLSLRRVSPKTCLWLATLVFLLVPVAVRDTTGLSVVFYPDINSHFPSALDSFYLGILMAGLENLGCLKKASAGWAVVGVVLWPLALLFASWLSIHPESNTFAMKEVVGWMVKIGSGCLLFLVADVQHPLARVLCAPWLRWCGIVSYEWYLIHQPMIGWVRTSYGPAGGHLSRYAAIAGVPFLVSVLVAALIYRYFSLPILKYARAKKRR
jgi:peptidoglycan/LPS O-acetylase OafA/YrhL